MTLRIDIKKNLGSFKLDVQLNNPSGILGFLGESGSGKSFCLKCIAGLETPDEGKIVLNDKVLFDSHKRGCSKICVKSKSTTSFFVF